ncbi:hypothetical protein HY624_01235 [Candidatus Uhrbacteria bacterium]|nr:hypothetical protein [Candidatus Uhrbacteria bacterium]
MSKKQPSLPSMIQWTVPEFPQYVRGQWWYVWVGVCTLVLLSYAVYTANFLFALIIFMGALIVFLHSTKTPSPLSVALDGRGLTIGDRQYPYRDLRSFWIVYDPPDVQAIHILFRSSVKPRLSLQLMDQNPVVIREFLRQFVEENLKEDDEPLTDTLSRFLRL